MAEKDNLEPTLQNEEQPTPQFSETTGGESQEQASSSASDLSELKEYIDKSIQSLKDVRFGKHETRLESLEEAISQYASLKGEAVDTKALSQMQGAAREQELLARLEALEGGIKPESSAGAGQKGWAARQATILSDAGIDPQDRRIGELMASRKFESEDDYINALNMSTLEWKIADANKPQPSSSTRATTVASVAPTEGDYAGMSDDELGARAIELGKEYTKNRPEIVKINAELERRAK